MSENFVVSSIYNDISGLDLSGEALKCFNILNELNIKYDFIKYNRAPETMEEKVLIDNSIGVRGIKNLLFCTENKKKIFFIIVYRDTRFDTKAFREKYGISKIHMCNDLELLSLLNTSSGRVSVIELLNDRENNIQLFIDPLILDEKYFRFHPNDTSITIRISTLDFVNVLIPYLKHNLNFI